jgi:hypothetical protein
LPEDMRVLHLTKESSIVSVVAPAGLVESTKA